MCLGNSIPVDITGGDPPFVIDYSTNEFFGFAGKIDTPSRNAVVHTDPSLAGKTLYFSSIGDLYCRGQMLHASVKIWPVPTATLLTTRLVYEI